MAGLGTGRIGSRTARSVKAAVPTKITDKVLLRATRANLFSIPLQSVPPAVGQNSANTIASKVRMVSISNMSPLSSFCCDRGRLLILCSAVRQYLHGFHVGVHEPCAPVFEVLQEFRIFLRPHVSRPDDLRAINIGIVEDPFVENEIVAGEIAHDHQMISGSVLKLLQNACTSEVLPIFRTPRAYPARLRSDMNGGGAGPRNEQNEAYRRNSPHQKTARRAASPLPGP